MSPTDILVVLGAGLLWFVLGAVWYSPILFADRWMAAHGKTAEQIKADSPSMTKPMVTSALVCLVQAFVIAFVVSHFKVESIFMAAMTGFMLALAFGLLADIRSHGFMPKNLTLIWIDKGYDLAGAPLAAAVIAWHLFG